MSQTVNGTANSRITVMRLGRLPGSDRKLTRCPSTWVLSGIVELQHPGAFLLLEGEIEIALRHGDPQLVRTALVKQLEDGLLDRHMVDVDLLDRRDVIETPADFDPIAELAQGHRDLHPTLPLEMQQGPALPRSAVRRVGKGCGSTCSTWWP